jgi:hypothetical protein
MGITQNTFDPWLSLLRKLFPIKGLIHVGAGAGWMLPIYRQWIIPNALLIEAESQLYSKLENKVTNQEGWLSLQAVIAGNTTQMPFYLSNNPNEHGLIAPENLTHLWRNLKTVDVYTAHAETLANILSTRTIITSASPYNWLIVGCLPAAEILDGLGDYISQIDVVIARTLLAKDAQPQNASKSAVDMLLSSHDFRAINISEENLPAVGQVLYVRDYKANSSKQQQYSGVLQQQLSALDTAKERAEQDNDVLRRQASSLIQKRDALVQNARQHAAALRRCNSSLAHWVSSRSRLNRTMTPSAGRPQASPKSVTRWRKTHNSSSTHWASPKSRLNRTMTPSAGRPQASPRSVTHKTTSPMNGSSKLKLYSNNSTMPK